MSLSLLYHHPTIFFPVNHQHLTIKVLVLTGTKEAEVTEIIKKMLQSLVLKTRQRQERDKTETRQGEDLAAIF